MSVFNLDEETRVQQETATLLRRLERQGRKEYVAQVAQELWRRTSAWLPQTKGDTGG